MRFEKTHQYFAILVFICVVCAYFVMAWHFPFAYIWATYEDLVGEWAQFYLFAATCFFSVKLSFGSRTHRFFFRFIAVVCFYVIMEEISWGQRLIGFASPEFFKLHNLQGEANLHNLLTGPISTPFKSLVELLLVAGLIIYGLIYPLGVNARVGPATQLSNWLPAPPLYLSPFFCTAALFELRLLHFNEAEIAEILIGFAMAFLTLQYLAIDSIQRNDQNIIQFDQMRSTGLALKYVALCIGILLLASGTTVAVYNVPSISEKIQKRIDNGVEKFAGRYVRYEQWYTAIRLYEHLLAANPHRPSLLRKVADCYQRVDDKQKMAESFNRALTVDLQRIQQNPISVSVNLSLARTYEKLGQTDQAGQYLETARRSANNRVRQNPNSASAAYWLGKSHLQLGDRLLAAEQFKKAFEIKPSSRKYRKSYFKYRTELQNIK